MQYLHIDNIHWKYGEKTLLSGVQLFVNKGDKVALVARNGSGKSTLLDIIAGKVNPEGDEYVREIHPSARMYYLSQDPAFGEKTILDSIFESRDDRIQALHRYKTADLSGDADALAAATLMMDKHNAWDLQSKIDAVCQKLGLSNLDREIRSLSGGERKRVAIAKMVLEEPDFVILDEPTNHLDLEMIVWLEEYLSNPNLTILMVTHDRYFLDRICNRIVELEQGYMHSYQGNYQSYLEKKALRTENERSAQEKKRRLLANELEWIRRMPKARTGKEKSRIDRFTKIREELGSVTEPSHFEIPVLSSRLGNKVLNLNGVSLKFESGEILSDFSYKFQRGEKVGVVGPNGAGKTTFLRILAGEISPGEGLVERGETVTIGFYRQSGLVLHQDKRVIDVIRDIAEYLPLQNGTQLSAEQLLERFLFPRPQQGVFVSKLSGGERRRLYLLTVLMSNPNFLMLDEPTNDLDIVTLNILEEYLMQFTGCLVVVSHDRYFLNKLVDHLFVMDGSGKITDFIGTYDEWRSEQADEPRKPKSYSGSSKDQKDVSESQAHRHSRKKLQQLEKRIEKLEGEKREIMARFGSSQVKPDDIASLSKRLGELESEIESLEEEWLQKSE